MYNSSCRRIQGEESIWEHVVMGLLHVHVHCTCILLMPCAHLNGMCVGVYFVPGEAMRCRVDYSNRLAGDTNGLVNSQ